MGSPKTYYTYSFKMKVITALDANEGNITKTAKQFSLAKRTVSEWNQSRERIFEQAAKYAEDRQLPLHQRLNMLINQISDALPGMVENARLGDATRALSTLIPLSEELKAKKEAAEHKKSNVYAKLERLLKPYRQEFLADPQAYIEKYGVMDEYERQEAREQAEAVNSAESVLHSS